ncbi:MAG TPA: ATP-binding cassette domain-containing protein [Acidimicrobiales bacterium]|nr:ATP-binding cassette domain-containing protein [Acidimicrobiales bacterium]
MTHALEVRGVRASYGRIEVLRGVDLAVPAGSVVALVGPNGGGKSTTLKVVSGVMAATAGCIHVAGRHVNGARPEDLARIGVATVPEGRGVFPNLTVAENLRMATYAGPGAAEVEADAFARFPILAERRHQLAGSMSGGEQQLLALARALAARPALLLLDELSMGLAPAVVARLYDTVAEVAAGGVSILLAEQSARVVRRVAGYAALMANGRVTAVGEPADLEDELSGAYLGG